MKELYTLILLVPPRQPDGIWRILHVLQDFYYNGIDDHLIVFLLMLIVIADIASGTARAWALGNFSSRKMRTGLMSHSFVFFTIAIGYPFVAFVGFSSLADLIISGLLVSYSLSFLRNLQLMGVNIPFIGQYIKDKVDNYKLPPELNDIIDAVENDITKKGLEEPKEEDKEKSK